MEFGLLGPLLARDGASELIVSAPRQRVLLAALLLKAGRVVGVDELAEALWADQQRAVGNLDVVPHLIHGDAGRHQADGRRLTVVVDQVVQHPCSRPPRGCACPDATRYADGPAHATYVATPTARRTRHMFSAAQYRYHAGNHA